MKKLPLFLLLLPVYALTSCDANAEISTKVTAYITFENKESIKLKNSTTRIAFEENKSFHLKIKYSTKSWSPDFEDSQIFSFANDDFKFTEKTIDKKSKTYDFKVDVLNSKSVSKLKIYDYNFSFKTAVFVPVGKNENGEYEKEDLKIAENYDEFYDVLKSIEFKEYTQPYSDITEYIDFNDDGETWSLQDGWDSDSVLIDALKDDMYIPRYVPDNSPTFANAIMTVNGAKYSLPNSEKTTINRLVIYASRPGLTCMPDYSNTNDFTYEVVPKPTGLDLREDYTGKPEHYKLWKTHREYFTRSYINKNVAIDILSEDRDFYCFFEDQTYLYYVRYNGRPVQYAGGCR